MTDALGSDAGPRAALDFYREHGPLSDPGSLGGLYGPLAGTPANLARVVQGLLIAPYEEALKMYDLKPGDIDNSRFGVRRAEDLLKRIESRHPGPLSMARPPKDRIGAICRNFTFLHVSMLRHRGVPARSRVGFAGYLWKDPTYWCDHRITEYWDEGRSTWVLADPWVDDVRQRAKGISVDTLDLRPSERFLTAGQVWQRCRSGAADPRDFGDSETDRGMPPIRYALLHDFAYLNKVELLGCDDWGDLITKPEGQLTADDLAFLDRVAALTVQPDQHSGALRSLFVDCAYGRAVLDKVVPLRAEG